MSISRGDASEVFRLAGQLEAFSEAVLPAVRPVMQSAADTVKTSWQANARVTAGAHGPHYPNSITYDTRVLANSVIADIGPDTSKPQGSMGRGFEFGSQNQPPHLDGLRAVDSAFGPTEKALNAAIDRLLP